MEMHEIKQLEDLMESCFRDEQYCMELRLSDKEIEYLRRNYPKAVIENIPDSRCNDGKSWYMVRL